MAFKTLHNGAIQLERRVKEEGKIDVVLCLMPDNCQRYVTWCMDVDTLGTYWGHYFNDLESAVRDYKTR